ncbi:MAG: LysM peptidoglycan-binding domain-containing protein [Bacteroidetes bacterium]|nr:LysM peptidoglycan-binding domain-containing protein [Bacteroidota bacterium]
MDGKKFILHKIEPKETWISLTKRYNCDLDELKSFNKGVEDLKIGQIINIPVSVKSEPTSISEPRGNKLQTKGNPVALSK